MLSLTPQERADVLNALDLAIRDAQQVVNECTSGFAVVDGVTVRRFAESAIQRAVSAEMRLQRYRELFRKVAGL